MSKQHLVIVHAIPGRVGDRDQAAKANLQRTVQDFSDHAIFNLEEYSERESYIPNGNKITTTGADVTTKDLSRILEADSIVLAGGKFSDGTPFHAKRGFFGCHGNVYAQIAEAYASSAEPDRNLEIILPGDIIFQSNGSLLSQNPDFTTKTPNLFKVYTNTVLSNNPLAQVTLFWGEKKIGTYGNSLGPNISLRVNNSYRIS